MKLCLSHVVDPVCFYANVQNDYDANQLMDLQNELNHVCTNSPVAEKLIVNKVKRVLASFFLLLTKLFQYIVDRSTLLNSVKTKPGTDVGWKP